MYNLTLLLSIIGITVHSTGIVFLLFTFDTIHWFPLIILIIGNVGWMTLFMGNIFTVPLFIIMFLVIFCTLGISTVFVSTYACLLLSYRWFKQFLPAIPSRKYHLEGVVDESLHTPKFWMLLLSAPMEILIISTVYLVITVAYRDYVYISEMRDAAHCQLTAKTSGNATETTQETCFEEEFEQQIVPMIPEERNVYNDITVDSGYIVSV
uniref:Transmembrane protein n=1 Tax=Bursaphelenchus xylophilus TaxID=6326 RepID=A0A1I7SBD8_BURXY